MQEQQTPQSIYPAHPTYPAQPSGSSAGLAAQQQPVTPAFQTPQMFHGQATLPYNQQVPYGQPAYMTPMMPFASPYSSPFGYPPTPMFGYPQPSLWMDPGFWQFVAAQGPHLIQQLMATYQAMHPQHTQMVAPRTAVPSFTPGMPTYPLPAAPIAPQAPAYQSKATPMAPQAPTYQSMAAPTPSWPTAPQTSPSPTTFPNSVSVQQTAQMPATTSQWGNGTPAVGTAPSPQPVPVAKKEVEPAASSSDDLQSMILNLVADRTGYDIEELGLDEHLEADLGIDSIRQVEVMAELRDTLELVRDDSFKITDYPTLRSLITYVQQNIPGGQNRESADSPDTSG